MRRFVLAAVLLAGSMLVVPALATSKSMQTIENREANRFGIYLGLLEPLGSILGANVAYNVTSFARVSGGFGWFPLTTSASNSGTTATGRANFFSLAGSVRFFVPTWAFSPTIGGGLTRVWATGTISVSDTRAGFNQTATRLFGLFGFDWQTRNGFNLGFGGQIFEGVRYDQSSSTLVPAVYVLPYLSLGIYLDWLNY